MIFCQYFGKARFKYALLYPSVICLVPSLLLGVMIGTPKYWVRDLIAFEWQEFNFGLELVLLIKFVESSLDGAAEDALIALDKLTMEFPSLIVQTTKGVLQMSPFLMICKFWQCNTLHDIPELLTFLFSNLSGSNFNRHSEEYTHGVVIRFRSCEFLLSNFDMKLHYISNWPPQVHLSAEAFEIFMNSSEYNDVSIWILDAFHIHNSMSNFVLIFLAGIHNILLQKLGVILDFPMFVKLESRCGDQNFNQSSERLYPSVFLLIQLAQSLCSKVCIPYPLLLWNQITLEELYHTSVFS